MESLKSPGIDAEFWESIQNEMEALKPGVVTLGDRTAVIRPGFGFDRLGELATATATQVAALVQYPNIAGALLPLTLPVIARAGVEMWMNRLARVKATESRFDFADSGAHAPIIEEAIKTLLLAAGNKTLSDEEVRLGFLELRTLFNKHGWGAEFEVACAKHPYIAAWVD